MEASKRVGELAAELGVGEADLIAHLGRLGQEPPLDADSVVSPDLLGAVTATVHARRSVELGADGTDSGPELQRVAELIKDAYEIARASGKPDWRRMQAGVLKNRLLLLTDKEFDESRFGATSFTRFLSLLQDVVRVDASTTPPVVELVGAGKGTQDGTTAGATSPSVVSPQSPAPWRIRSDLWSAVLDYAKGFVFVWDNGAVRAIPPDAFPLDDPRPRFPTISPEELRDWRFEFTHLHSSSPDHRRLVAWAESSGTSYFLPRRLRDDWFETLKGRVRNRLDRWFEANGIAPPPDMIEATRPARTSGSDKASDSTADLRALVVRCVEAMTRAELEDLRLPPMAVLRSRS